MRYLFIVAALVFVLAAAGYTAYAFDTGNTARKPGQAGPVINVSEYPDYLSRTCSGDEPRLGAQTFFFGFTRPGLCMTRVIYANTYGEARECALALCRDCRVEDITSWYQFGSSVRDPEGKLNYCPK